MSTVNALLPDPSWAFAELTQKQTGYVTHSYHRYPAKFIPQLAARLINEYSERGDLVVDPFMGSGTTLVEAKLLGRPSVGVDINPVAHLIARAKTTAIDPERLACAIGQLRTLLRELSNDGQLTLFSNVKHPDENVLFLNDRLRYWFDEATLRRLAQVQAAVDALFEEDMRVFFYCAISHVLKPLSFWRDRSVKPTRELGKRIPEVSTVLLRHIVRMQRGNQEFCNLLRARDCLHVPAEPHCADARRLPVESAAAQLIVTSPPYVTSYEYADLHQLSALWFRWASDLRTFREGFIGRSNGTVGVGESDLHSPLAAQIVAQVDAVCPKKAREIGLYFSEMFAAFQEMHRVLRRGGYTCVVIGNTSLCGVEIQNAQVFMQQLEALGFVISRVILREIPSKILPRTRDKATGKFTGAQEADYIAYPTEYVVVAQKVRG